MEYMRHKYSKRVYQVMRDHGEDHPYLACHPFVRYTSQGSWPKFFSPCGKPEEPQDIKISVLEEIEWEKKQLRREEPIRVQAPASIEKPKKRRVSKSRATPESGEYTLKDLCMELGLSPATARKLLRSKGKTAPDGGWRWPDKESAKPIKKFLKKFL